MTKQPSSVYPVVYSPTFYTSSGVGSSAVRNSLNFTPVHWLIKRELLAAFFNSFRKGPVVCRGLDVNLSTTPESCRKKTTLTRLSGRHAHIVFLPLAIAAYEICYGVTVHGYAAATAYIHKGCNCYAFTLWQCKT